MAGSKFEIWAYHLNGLLLSNHKIVEIELYSYRANYKYLVCHNIRCPRTHIPSLQPPHVYIPVYSEQHNDSEYKHPQHSEKAHDNAVDHIEEKEHKGENLIQWSAPQGLNVLIINIASTHCACLLESERYKTSFWDSLVFEEDNMTEEPLNQVHHCPPHQGDPGGGERMYSYNSWTFSSRNKIIDQSHRKL